MRSNKPPATPIEFQVRGLPRLTSGNRNPQMPIELLASNPKPCTPNSLIQSAGPTENG